MRKDRVGRRVVGDGAWLSEDEEGVELRGGPRWKVDQFGCSVLWCEWRGGRGRGCGRRGICGDERKGGSVSEEEMGGRRGRRFELNLLASLPRVS